MSYQEEFQNFYNIQMETIQADEIIVYEPEEPAPSQAKPKRVRTAFSSAQLSELEREFGINKYPDQGRRMAISRRINLPEKQVRIWYQNRRMKIKKDAARAARSGQQSESSRKHVVPPLPQLEQEESCTEAPNVPGHEHLLNEIEPTWDVRDWLNADSPYHFDDGDVQELFKSVNL